MKAKIKYGVCADNNDPYNAGRIRVLVDKEEKDRFIKNTYVKTIMDEIDSQNRGSYVKWQLATERYSNDPYVVNPLLPKNFNVVPKVGESVKLLLFGEGANSYMEYIGPEISNKNKTNFELYEEGRGFTDERLKNPVRYNFDDFVYPDTTDVAFIGRNNTDLILGESEVVIRSGFRTNDGLRKSDKFGLFQVSKYITTKVSTKEERTINTTPNAIVNYMVEYLITTTPSGRINLRVDIYPTDTILNTRNYQDNIPYLEDNSNVVISIQAESESVNKIQNFLNNLISNLDNNLFVLESFNNVIENGLTYFVEDFRPPINGEDQVGERSFNIGLYAFRNGPEQVIDGNVDIILENIPNQLRPISKVPTQTSEVIEVDVLEELNNTAQTVTYSLSDITFLLSSQTDPTLTNQVTRYGYTQEKMNTVLLKQTEPMVRGRKLANILLRILDIIDIHGHSTDGPATISENVKEELKSLKDELNTILNDDINNSSDLVNENLRIN